MPTARSPRSAGPVAPRFLPHGHGPAAASPQVVPIRFRHCPFAAESRRNPLYTYGETALDVNVPRDLPPVRGDRVHLQQVLLNLILNGMDALNGASLEDRRVNVTALLDGPQTVEIAVSDTGIGIPDDKLAHVFDPFFTTKPDGMGMGLPISRTIIEAHGGRFWAENNQSGGATFRFTLPIAEEAAAK